MIYGLGWLLGVWIAMATLSWGVEEVDFIEVVIWSVVLWPFIIAFLLPWRVIQHFSNRTTNR